MVKPDVVKTNYEHVPPPSLNQHIIGFLDTDLCENKIC